jgi:hypothetical protein
MITSKTTHTINDYISKLSSDEFPVKSGKINHGETIIRIKNSLTHEYVWMKFYNMSIRNSQNIPVKIMGIAMDIDAQIMETMKLKKQAEQDSLTGLFNRGTTESLINDILKIKDSGKIHAYILIDIDNFKEINDSMGHMVGDQILKDISKKIKYSFYYRILITLLIMSAVCGCGVMKKGNSTGNLMLKDIAYDKNKKSGYTVYLKENASYIPFLVLTKDYNGNTLLLREKVMEEDHVFNDYVGYYRDSLIDKYLSSDYLAMLDPVIQNNIPNTEIAITLVLLTVKPFSRSVSSACSGWFTISLKIPKSVVSAIDKALISMPPSPRIFVTSASLPDLFSRNTEICFTSM